MKKRLLGLLMTAVMIAAVGSPAMADEAAELTVNDIAVEEDSPVMAPSFTELNAQIFTAKIPGYDGAAALRSFAENLGNYPATGSVTLTKGNYYQFTNNRQFPVQLKTSNQWFYIDICDSAGTVTSKPASSTMKNTGVTVEPGETFYFYVSGNSSVPANDTITGNYAIGNTRDTAYSGSPYVVTTSGGSTYYTSKGSEGEIWYKRTFDNAEYFRVSSNADSCRVFINDSSSAEETVHANETSEPVKCDKGDTAYICISGSYGNAVKVTDKSYQFTELTSISYSKSVYTVGKGKTISLPLTWSKEVCDMDGDGSNDPYESTVKYYVDGSSSAYETITGEKNNADVLKFKSNKIGKHTIKAVTSEGLKAKTTVVVTPAAVPASDVKSVGSCRKSKISWSTVNAGAGTDGYTVYLKNSSGKYVKQGTTTGSGYTLTGLSSNKTYYIKVAGYVKVDGKKYASSSSAKRVKVVTASAKKPVITSLKSAGRKYYAKTWVKGYWTAAGHWVNGYWIPARTVFNYTAKYTKVSGATGYDANTTGFKASTGKGSETVQGSKSSATFTVKIRSIRKSGTSTAYGPWSAGKSVTVR